MGRFAGSAGRRRGGRARTSSGGGLQKIGAVTGTFEDINKAANEFWQGTDGRNGATSPADPDLGILDAGILTLGGRT